MRNLQNSSARGKRRSTQKKLRLAVALHGGRFCANGALRSIHWILSAQRDASITVITDSPEPMLQKIAVDIARIPAIGTAGLWKTWTGYIFGNIQVARILKKWRPDAMHVNDPGMFWHVFLACALLRVPVILNLRNTSPAEPTLSFKHFLMALMSSVVVTLSQEMTNYWKGRMCFDGFGFRPPFLCAFSPAEPLQATDAQRESARRFYGFPTNGKVVLWPGAVTARKQQAMALKALVDSKVDLQNIYVAIAGDGDPDYIDECRRLVAASEMCGVIRFMGYQADLSRLYIASDLVLITSRNEGLARVMIESMAAGLPVVSTDVCSAAEFLLRYNAGIVCDKNDMLALWRHAVSLARNVEARMQMGRVARGVAKVYFNPSEVARRYAIIYNKFRRL